MLQCILGSCGTGKSYRMRSRIRDSIARGSRVIVLSPEQFSSEAEDRLYTFLKAKDFNRIETYSFVTLSREILLQCGRASRSESYASEQEKLVYLYDAVQSCAQEGLLRQLYHRSRSPEFTASLYPLITKLRKSGSTSEKLIAVSEGITRDPRFSDKLSDLGHILLAYDRILREHGRFDSLVNLTEAAALADAADWFSGAEVFIDEFDSFTGDQYQMLEVILRQAESVTIALRADDPVKKPSGIFVGGNRTFREMKEITKKVGKEATVEYCPEFLRSAHADLKAVSTGVLRQDATSAAYGRHVHLFQAAAPEDEVSYICAEIARLLTENSDLRCSDISIAVKNMDVYAPLFEQAMRRYHLPCYIGRASGVLHTELVRVFLMLLEIIADGDTWNTEHLMHYLKAPLAGYSASTVSMLEHYCFTWSVDGVDWETPFYEKDSENAGRAGEFGGEILEKLRTKLISELTDLRRACRKKSVQEICTAVYRFLEKKKNTAAFIREKNEKTLPELVEKEFVTIWNLLCDTMDTVVQCCGDQILSPSKLRDTFTLLLGGSSFATPPQTLDTICIVDAQTARLNDPKIVFVPEMCDGVYPAEIVPSGMFSEEELRFLDEKDIRISRLLPELYSDELLIISRIVSAPSERLYLTWPQVNAAHELTQPSPVTDEIARLLITDPAQFDEKDPDTWLMQEQAQMPPAFYTRTKEAVYHQFVRCLNDPTKRELAAAMRELLSEDPVYAARVERISSLADHQPEQISEQTMELLLPAPLRLSASGIEKYYSCPFQYFCQYLLRLYTPEQNTLGVKNIGNFAHYCLEKMLAEYRPDVLAGMTIDEINACVQKLSAEFFSQNFSDAMQRDMRFRFQYRKTGESVLQLLEHLKTALQDGAFVPQGYEVQIRDGLEAGNGFPAMRLQDGKILIEGKIDRVDLSIQDDGTRLMRVVDYKTGNKSLMTEKISEGLDMQMLIYLYALEQNGAYQGAKPGGVLYMPSGQPSAFQKRTGTIRPVKEVLDDFYCMKGLINLDAADSMELSLRTAMKPVLAHPGSATVFSATPLQMEHLQGFVEEKICDMSEALHKGMIGADPCLHIGKGTACTYCPYADLCGKATMKAVNLNKAQRDEATALAFGPAEAEETEEDAE